MRKKYYSPILTCIGIFFLVVGMSAIVNTFINEEPTQILYLCYLGLLLMGVVVLTRNSFLILSQVYILTIPLAVWNIDFFYQLFAGGPLFGITDYFFVESTITLGKIISLQHIFSVPLALYAVNLIGVNRKDGWKLSFVEIIFIFLAVTALSPSELNVNCVYEPCLDISPRLPYELVWFFAIFSMTFFTSKLLHRFRFIKVKVKTKK